MELRISTDQIGILDFLVVIKQFCMVTGNQLSHSKDSRHWHSETSPPWDERFFPHGMIDADREKLGRCEPGNRHQRIDQSKQSCGGAETATGGRPEDHIWSPDSPVKIPRNSAFGTPRLELFGVATVFSTLIYEMTACAIEDCKIASEAGITVRTTASTSQAGWRGAVWPVPNDVKLHTLNNGARCLYELFL